MVFLLLLIASSFAAEAECDGSISNCATCDDGGTAAVQNCLSCSDKFYLDAETPARCQACGKNCDACDKDKCTTCQADSAADPAEAKDCLCGDGKGNPAGAAGACTDCTAAAGADKCAKCSANNAVCTECKAGNGLVGDQCQACTDGGTNANCISCDDNVAQCKKCATSYFLSGTPGVKDDACPPCDLTSFCKECTAVKTCSQCDDGKGLSAADTPENTCEEGTVKGCKVFSTMNACTTCETGSRRTSETVCDACIDGCDNCDDDVTTCMICRKGYTLEEADETCSEDAKSKSSAVVLVFSFVGLLAMLF